MTTLVAKTTKKSAILTRRFGLTPVVRCPSCQAECQRIKEKKQKKILLLYYCNTCKMPLIAPDKATLPLDFFQKVEKATNILIQVGVTFSPEIFERDSLIAMKQFYNKAKKEQSVQILFKQIKLHNRLQRCAAQYAYYAVREYQRRTHLVRLLAQHLTTKLQTSSDLELFSRSQFPSRELVQEGRELLLQHFPAYRGLSTAFLQNQWRHVRNLLIQIVRKQRGQEESLLFKDLTFPKEGAASSLASLQTHYEEHLKTFLKGFSNQLTRRITRLTNRQAPEWRKGTFDPLLADILGSSLTETPNFAHWQSQRKIWRDITYDQLNQLKLNYDFSATLEETIQQITETFSFLQLLRSCLYNRYQKQRLWYSLDIRKNWHYYLQREAESQLWRELVKQNRSKVLAAVQQACQLLVACPRDWLKVPRFEKEAVPYGADDGQVFHLWVGTEGTPAETSPKAYSFPVYVRLTIAPRINYEFRLNTPQRFHRLINRGFKWVKPVLTKSAKGTLTLAIPFQTSVEKSKKTHKNLDRMLSVDLGLKTIASLSVVEGLTPLEVEKTKFTKKEYSQLFHDQSVTDFELARYFLDQRELQLPVANWFLLKKKALKGKKNFKRALYHLQTETAKVKSQQTQYRNRHKKRYKQKQKYWDLRRQWKRLWRKLKALHEELARQIAIRILSVACHHQVRCIRFEDLSWAQHSAKADSGYWLATWQVHWFYSQIQALVAEGAARFGITVETINPRETSQRCSHCGRSGERKRKRFHCSYCGKEMDSDLNAARNIHLVPSSPLVIYQRVQPPESG